MTVPAAALAVVLAAALAGCVAATSRPPSPPIGAPTGSEPSLSTATIPTDEPPSAPGGTAVPTPQPSAAASDPAPSVEPTLEPPPAADLRSGGVEQPGVPGGYTWRGGSESAPWLPADALEAVTVSAGRVEIAIDPPVERWVARVADVADTTGASASPLASGDHEISFEAPASGHWVLAVEVVFASGAGDAAYYWEVAVP